MRIHRFSPLVVAILTYYQILGPVALWAANEQRGLQIERRGRNIVTSIQGDVTRRGDSSSDTQPLLFKDLLNLGDEIRTTEKSNTQILLGSSGLVTLGVHTSIQLNQEENGQPVISLRKGHLELAAAKSQMQPGEVYTIQTPQGRITTEGGLLQIQVRQSGSAASLEQSSRILHLVRTSSTARVVPVALTSPTIETITVREGSASVASTRTAQEAQTVEAGQTLQLGENAPSPFDSSNEPIRDTLNICATGPHCETPEPAQEFVQAQQLGEAQALSQVLIGAEEESTEGQAQTDEDVILATTAGVGLSSTTGTTGGETLLTMLFGPGSGAGAGNQGVGSGNGSVNGTLFGEGNGTLSGFGNGIGGGGLESDNQSGSGIGDDNQNAQVSIDTVADILVSAQGGLGLLAITKLAPLSEPEQSSTFSSSELLLVDGGVLTQAPHAGQPPLSTLLVRGIQDKFHPPSLTASASNTATDLDLSNSFSRISNSAELDPNFPLYEIRVTNIQVEVIDNFTRTTGTFTAFKKSMGLEQEVASSTSRSFIESGSGDDNNFSRVSLDFDGLSVEIDIDGEIDEGDVIFLSAIDDNVLIDGNTGANIREVFFTEVGEVSEEEKSEFEVVLVKSPQDSRTTLVSGALDTNSADDPLRDDPSTPDDDRVILADFSSRTDGKACSVCGGGDGNQFSALEPSFVDARVTARSAATSNLPIFDANNPSNDRTVELLGGVVLTNQTTAMIANKTTRQNFNFNEQNGAILPSPPSATTTFFTDAGLGTTDNGMFNPEYDSSVIGIIADEGNPAFVRIQDRILAVLQESSITPKNNINVALLSVLDGQLIGPQEVSAFRKDTSDNAIVPPILDIGNPGGGSNQQNQATVEVTSAAVIRSTGVESDVLVPDSLLQLESPLMSLINSTVTTSSHFADFQTTRPNDLLFSADFSSNVEKQKAVLVVDNSTVTVENGHLFHVQQGHMQITDGVLFSNTNGGNIDIQNGTLVNLTDGATFTLAHHAFGGFESFDSSHPGLSVDNSLCASGNCETLTALNGFEYEGLRVAGVSSQEDLLERVKVPRLFVPFLFENNQPDDDQPLNAFVADQNTAFLNVAGGSTLTVTLPLEFAQNHPNNLEALSQTDADVTVNFPGGGGLLVFGDTSGLTRTTSVCAGVGDNQTCQQNADNSAVLVEQAVENPGAGTKTTTTFVLTELNSLNANSELERQNEFNGGTRVVDGTPQVEPITQILNTSQLTATTELLLVDGETPDPSAPELETLIITGHQGDITEVPDTSFFAPAGIPVSETDNQARLVVHSPIATPLEISGGIILADASSLTTTQDVVAVVNSGNSPASVTFGDRALAVLEESTLTSEAALLNIVGSHVQGPSVPSPLRTDNGGNPLISPLLDIFARTTKPDLSNSALDSDVTVTSAIVVQSNGELNDVDLGQRQVNGVTIDRGILDASAPLITLVNSVMTATSHGIDLQGSPDDTHAIFTAGLPNDALVVVDGSLLTIQTGNLVNLNNGSATVSGLLFSIANGGHLNIANGALVGLSGTSQFNLVSNAFGAFSGATDTLTINNGLCSTGCTPLLDATGTPFAPLPNGTQLQVAGGGTVSITSPSFTPFLAPEVPNIDIGPDDAFLNVEENATVTISAN